MSELRPDEDFRRRRHHGGEGAWIGAVILIGIGVVFLLRNMGFWFPENWWALFLLIPAGGSLAAAWRVYQRDGAVTGPVMGSLFAAAILIALMLVFLLNVDINWNLLWPVALILLGLSLLTRSYWRR
jgi:hypothetical protein